MGNATHWQATIEGNLVSVRVGPDGISAEMGPAGNPLSVAVQSLCATVNVGLKAGVPFANYVHGLRGQRFSPCGPTGDPLVPDCTSVVDYIIRSVEARQ